MLKCKEKSEKKSRSRTHLSATNICKSIRMIQYESKIAFWACGNIIPVPKGVNAQRGLVGVVVPWRDQKSIAF